MGFQPSCLTTKLMPRLVLLCVTDFCLRFGGSDFSPITFMEVNVGQLHTYTLSIFKNPKLNPLLSQQVPTEIPFPA